MAGGYIAPRLPCLLALHLGEAFVNALTCLNWIIYCRKIMLLVEVINILQPRPAIHDDKSSTVSFYSDFESLISMSWDACSSGTDLGGGVYMR